MNRYTASLAIVTMFIFTSFSLRAEPPSFGLGISASDSPYKGYGTQYDPLPHIDYDNGKFFIDDTSVGAYLYNHHQQELSIGFNYLSSEFEPSNSDDRRLKKLNKRHSTLASELLYEITTLIGVFSTGLSVDLLNQSHSVLIDTNYTFPIFYKNWTFIQTGGINWANTQHNNYYYGVSHREANRSGLAYHHAKSTLSPYLSFTANYHLTGHINTFAGVRIDKLTGDVKNSPMIANSTIPNLYAGINYQF